MPRKPKAKAKAMSNSSDTPFEVGTPVEISLNDVGFRGSWYTGTIIRRANSKKPAKYWVEYTHLFANESGTKHLIETIDLYQLRPTAPRDQEREFKVGEEVDAFYNDGWWEGVITEVKDGKFSVYFRNSKEQIRFSKEDLRLHREWVAGEWKPSLEEETESEKVPPNDKTEEGPDKVMPEEQFTKGTLVEVSSDEEGFQGAWFAATIVEPAGNGNYLVEYQSLRTEDDKEFLKEEIDVMHIRPSPPDTYMVDSFSKLDEVDALYNDGWWVGVISKVLSNSRYMVYFKPTDEEIQFEHSELRLHQDWIDGKWVVASRALNGVVF